MCQNEPWGAIVVPTEVHSTWRGQPPRTNRSVCLVEVRAKWTKRTTRSIEQRNCNLLQVDRSKAKQTPPDQGSDPDYDPLLEG